MVLLRLDNEAYCKPHSVQKIIVDHFVIRSILCKFKQLNEVYPQYIVEIQSNNQDERKTG
jgi:hypothetical protein